MTGPQPPEQPYSPEFRVPPMTPVQPGGLDDPADRKRRMRMGILGAAIGLAIPLILVGIAVALGLGNDTGGTDAWIDSQFFLLAAIVLASPAQLVAGVILAMVQRTRPFGVGFLIGAGIGAVIMAGACFVPLAAANA